jgi:2-(1,2-epoxy-1,2-dihydrophenyl)acetyl-CoA isomerase
MELALLSPTLDAAEALRIGLVNRVVAGEELEREGIALARRLAEAAPQALARTKALIRAGWSATLADQLQAEQDAFVACAATEDFTEALDAFFGKRRPVFTGR